MDHHGTSPAGRFPLNHRQATKAGGGSKPVLITNLHGTLRKACFFLPSNLPCKSTKTRANIAHTIHGTIAYLPIHEWLIVYGFHVGKYTIVPWMLWDGLLTFACLPFNLLFSNTWNPGSHLSTLRLDPKKQHGNKTTEPLEVMETESCPTTVDGSEFYHLIWLKSKFDCPHASYIWNIYLLKFTIKRNQPFMWVNISFVPWILWVGSYKSLA